MAVISTFLGAPSGSYTETAFIPAASLTGNIADTVPIMTVQDGWIVNSVDVIYTGTASSTVSVGDSGSATKYVNAASTATTGSVMSGPIYNKYVAPDTIFATLAGANIAAKAYTFVVKFQRVYQ